MAADFPFGETPETQGRYLTHSRWEATLSDGRKAIQQDGGDGVEPSTWLALRDWCATQQLHVVALHLRFRSHIVSAGPENAPGYFFRPGLAGSPGSPDKQTLLAGHLDADTGRVLVVTWFAPELHPMWSEWRDPADERGVGPSLIRRPSADGPESGGAADA